ncbi:NADH dehydrogenase [ubiquinone] 1 subunit C2 [Parasteatoda tepidariorum]|uniref:NADH dehydrogenase [ubiquinone] 1 subunit C2 n=1 Tax=Parasteatoda tepidariorum TaxID=114398 RepID=A0A2L2Y1T0_PARTP|nr:NADH dehydrogenase [ubiquinone] 1 subunit C2 [Parasteatoda tepidariorum]
MPAARESLEIKYFYHLGFSGMFALSPVCANYYQRRPLYAGIHRHILLGILGFAVGHYVTKYLDNKWVERDAIIRHYVELHPEDFKVERKKFKEIFDEWYPIR